MTHPTDPATMPHGDRAPGEPVTLAGFLAARLADDEAAALAPSPGGQRLAWHAVTDPPEDEGSAPVHWVLSDGAAAAVALGLERGTGPQVAAHIARHDPSRALREVEAGRKLLAAYEAAVSRQAAAAEGRAPAEPEWHIARRAALEFAVAVRAQVWSDHPDYGSWGRGASLT